MTDKIHGADVPTPPDPHQRKESLPWERPKPTDEDPESPGKLQSILNSSSYLPAVEDIGFLEGYDTLGIRLQLDYLKPEKLLKQRGVEYSIVVFGSTRIAEPLAARQKVKYLRDQIDKGSDDPELHRRLFVAERLLANSRYYDVARELAQRVAESGAGPDDSRLVVTTGGGPGVMEAANRGAHEAGADSVGLNITLPNEQFPNPYITPGLCFQFHYFSVRKMHFLLRARALVAFPGGYGTFDEIFETLTLIQTRTIRPIPVVLVGEAFWRKAFDVDFLVDEGVIDTEDRELFWFAETADDIWNGLHQWYQLNGDNLIPGE